jgi:hypothetical protein
MPAGGQGKGQPAGFQLHRFLSEHSPQGFQFIGEFPANTPSCQPEAAFSLDMQVLFLSSG